MIAGNNLGADNQERRIERPRPRLVSGLARLGAVCFLIAILVGLLFDLNRALVLPTELATIEIVGGSWSTLGNQLLYWPYYFLAVGVDLFVGDPLISARLVSIGLGWVAVVCFWLILCRLSNIYIALAGTLLLATNAWFVHLAQMAGPLILPLTVIMVGLVWSLVCSRRQKTGISLELGWLLIGLVGCFCPGLIWGILIVWAWLASRRFQQMALRLFIGFLVAGWLILLGVGILTGQDQVSRLAGFATLEWGQFFPDMVASLSAIVWQAPANPEFWLGHFGLLDVLGVVLLPVGVWVWLRRYSLGRRLGWLAIGGGWLVLVALGGGPTESPAFSLIIGLVLLAAAVGLVEVWRLWRSVFPSNPIAKTVAVCLLLLLLGLSSFYQTYKHFIVYPRALPTANLIEPTESTDP